jgi:hypothetical protein
MARIQGHMRKGKTLRRLPAERTQPILQDNPTQGSEATIEEPHSLGLSVIKSHHEKLIGQPMLEFGVQASKAYQLVVSRKETVILQLEAWPFRNAKPRNRAGWMIQAVEGNYEAPASYFEEKRKRRIGIG